jgi:beta-xylosidase
MQTPTLNLAPAAGDGRFTAPASFAYPWMPDQGDGTYCNPVLYADYSDPDVVRVGDDFYLVASSFNCTPGLPILHSRDLVNWTLLGHALKNLPYSRYEQVQPGCGVWAPAIRHHAGQFWIFFPTPDEGIHVITAPDPAGPWSKPHLLQAGKGLIDPCPLWDEDGRAYLVHAYAKSRSGLKHMLRVRPMAPDGSKLLGEGQIVFHDPVKHPTLEGPKFMKRDGWYYLLAPAGGVETGWQVVLRSQNVYGPYEDRIVLAQGGTEINGPHQGALVDTPDNGWWFLHFQDQGVYGRLVHLQPVEWQDGWPVMGRSGEPVSRHTKPLVTAEQVPCGPQTSDEFSGPQLGRQWQWQANHRDEWYSLSQRPGWLRLYPQFSRVGKLAEFPSLLLQKFPARSFLAEAALKLVPRQPGEEAGLVVMGQSAVSLGLLYNGEKTFIVLRTDETLNVVAEAPHEDLKIRLQVFEGGKCRFSYGVNRDFLPVGEVFQAKKGNWIGAKTGLYSLKRLDKTTTGHAEFDYFRLLSSRQP